MEWNNNKRIETPMEGEGCSAIRLFETIRKDSESNVEYKKMTVMAPSLRFQRIMKAFTYQPKEFQLFDMLSATLKLSDFQVDVLTVITMMNQDILEFRCWELKYFLIHRNSKISIILMDWTLDAQKGEEFQYNSLQTLSNLAINDNIRPQILHLKGIELFLKVFRESYRVDAQRLAAKELLNLSIQSRQTILSIVSLMEEKILLLQRREMDTVFQGYLTTLLITRERGQVL